MIRKKNLKLNWKYALGEIVLIFLGISLAVGFQNWNQTRLDGNKEEVILNALKTNLGFFIQELETKNKKEDLRINDLNSLLNDKMLSPFLNNEKIDSIFWEVVYAMDVTTPTFLTYYELKNGGQINIIENQSIKEKLMQLEAFIDENENTMADRLVIQQNLIDSYLVDNVDVPYFMGKYEGLNVTGNTIDHDIKSLVLDTKLRSRLSYKLALSVDHVKDVDKLLAFCRLLIVEIKNELN
jgi:hypothetical protein